MPVVRHLEVDGLFYWLVKFTLRPLFRVFFTPRVTGAENIPTRGGALLASNHLSMSDSLFLPVMTRRRVSFLAKKEYFTGRGLKGRAKAAFVRGTGLIPLDRDDADAAAAALATGARAVRKGLLLGVYPEGTRSPDGRLYRGKTGVARMAMDTGVPVVPVAMVGTDRVQPIGKVVPRLARVGVRIGAPLRPPVPSEDPAVEKRQVREFTERVMAAIAALSGQQRIDLDAAEHKRALRGPACTAQPADPVPAPPVTTPALTPPTRSPALTTPATSPALTSPALKSPATSPALNSPATSPATSSPAAAVPAAPARR